MTTLIRDLKTIDDFRLAEEAQQRIWGMTDHTEIVPLNMMLTAAMHGGIALGAYEDDDMVGLLFGFVGLDSGGLPKHCSHMLGLVPGTRHRGIGAALKLAQRDRVLAQGMDLVTWTFDPLESVNAYFNFVKLGTVSATYYRNHYGTIEDDLNSGLPTDRLEVEWWIDSEATNERLAGRRSPVTHAVAEGAGAQVIDVLGDDTSFDAERVLVPIPYDSQQVRRTDPALASQWRFGLRDVLESAFEAGYSVVDFLAEPDRQRSAYLLSKIGV